MSMGGFSVKFNKVKSVVRKVKKEVRSAVRKQVRDVKHGMRKDSDLKK